MSKASDAWTALEQQMENARGACLGDPRFTDDTTPAAELAVICNTCPLSLACSVYSQAARPTGGVWAGKRFTTNTKREDTP